MSVLASNLSTLLGPPAQPPRDRPSGLRLATRQDVRVGINFNQVPQPKQKNGPGPQRAVLHVGAQLRYLIESEHGLLGALGFAASALAIAARDEWIGWPSELRRKRLHGVLGLSRFLIRTSVQCRCLASKVLGMVLRQLPGDFQRRYRYRPALVETFVDRQRHAGTCLRAANWILVGDTAGRGRFAPPGRQVPVKSIWVYPLQRDWRGVLGA